MPNFRTALFRQSYRLTGFPSQNSIIADDFNLASPRPDETVDGGNSSAIFHEEAMGSTRPAWIGDRRALIADPRDIGFAAGPRDKRSGRCGRRGIAPITAVMHEQGARKRGWMRAPWSEAKELQKPLPDNELMIVASARPRATEPTPPPTLKSRWLRGVAHGKVTEPRECGTDCCQNAANCLPALCMGLTKDKIRM